MNDLTGPFICGIDEAGRGPLAGPVCAASVVLPAVLPADFPSGILNDSKKLSPRNRNKAAELIFQKALAWGIGWASPAEIDEMNILRASLLAMSRSYKDMTGRFEYLLESPQVSGRLEAVIDGLYVPELPLKARALVKADQKIPAVMAASILAKTARDRMMVRYSWLYPEYGYEKHKGYPTKAHRECIARYGFSPIQRRSFTVKGVHE